MCYIFFQEKKKPERNILQGGQTHQNKSIKFFYFIYFLYIKFISILSKVKILKMLKVTFIKLLLEKKIFTLSQRNQPKMSN